MNPRVPINNEAREFICQPTDTLRTVANGIYDACGVRMKKAPFTPERVLAALMAKKQACACRPVMPAELG